MSMMISPRSQENQYHYQQQNPPPPVPATAASYPIYSQFPQQAQQQGQQPPNGSFNTTLAYNNNYTTTNPLPPSNNSSFSLPSVPQAVYYEQLPPQPNQQQQQQQQIQQAQHTAGEAAATGPVYYYQQQYFTQPPTSTSGPGAVTSTSNPNFHDQFGGYPQFGFHDQAGQLNTLHTIPAPHQQSSTTALPPAGSATLPQPTGTTTTSSATGSNHGQSTSEEVPFPGILDPSSYNRNNSTSSATYHPRSATYPVDHKPIKHSRQSLTTSSLLGMTPETARRNRCTICQKQFKRPSSLQTHLYSHTGEKPFACTWDNCGRLFSVRSNMIRHKKLHERDAKLKNGNTTTDLSSDGSIKDEDVIKENGNAGHNTHSVNGAHHQQQQNHHLPSAGGFNGSLPNILHPTTTGNGGSTGDFQLGYFN